MIIKMKELEKMLNLLPDSEAIKLKKWFKEKIFKKSKELKNPGVNYKPIVTRRDVIWVDFGENVGQEICGIHPSIVIYANNGSGTVIVIPLTTTEVEHNLGVELGPITGMEVSYAKVDQIKCISRLRIIRKKAPDGRYYNNCTKNFVDESTVLYNNPKATAEQMNLIDSKISQFFLKAVNDKNK